MEINKRILYLSYLIIGFIFIVTGVALKEPEFLVEVFNYSPEDWYVFLLPWIGDAESGFPTPW